VKRSSWVLAGSAVLTLVVIAAFLLLPGRSLPRDLLAGVPRTALGVLHLRVDHLVRSPAYERLVVARGQAQGIARLQKLCGFHPLRGIEEALVLALPNPQPGAKRPRIALLARGAIPHTRLMRCVQLLGHGSSELVQEEIEGVTTVRSKNGSTRAAFIGSDGVVAGEAEAVRAVIEVLAKKQPSLLDDAELSALYHAVDAQADVAGAARVAGNESALSTSLAALNVDAATLAGLGLVAVSGSVRFEAEALRGQAQLITRDPARAAQLVERAEGVRRGLLDLPAISFTGFGRPLRELTLRAEGSSATLSGSLSVGTVATALELVPALTALQRGLAQSPAVPSAGDAGAAPESEAGDDEADDP
jgi:hypothetical protein